MFCMFDMIVNMFPCLLVQVKSKLKGHSKRITGLAFSNVLNVLVSSGADAQVRTIFFCFFEYQWDKINSLVCSSCCFSFVYGTQMDGRSKEARFCHFHREDQTLHLQTRVFSSTKIKLTSSSCTRRSLLFMKQPSSNA